MPRADLRAPQKGISFTTEKKILLHSLDYAKYEDEFEVPFAISQEGIAGSVGIRRDNVPRAMRRLKEDGVVYEKVVRVQGVKRRRKVYFLTVRGKEVAIKFRHLAEAAPVSLVQEDGNQQNTTLGEAVKYLLEHTTVPVSIVSVIRALVRDGAVDVKSYTEGLERGEPEKEAAETGRVSIIQDAPRPRSFVGRVGELERLNAFLSGDSARVMVIYGIAGIGKTTLASKMMYSLEGKKDILWYRFHRWDTLRNILNTLADFLSRLNRKRLKGSLSSNPNLGLHEIARILEDDLADLDGALFFDDYQRAKGPINDFFSLLLEMSEKVDGPKLVVVGRRILPFYDRGAVLVRKNVEEMRLDGLDPETARAYLIDKGVSSHSVDAIYQRTKGHPLFLELMSTARDVEDIKDLKRYIYEEIFQNLAEDEKTLLRIASVFRYPVSSSAFFMEEGIGYEVVDSLVERNLLQEMTYDEYDIHDLIREFFYTRLTPGKKREYHKSAADYYLEEGSDMGAMEATWHFTKAQSPKSAMSLLAKEGTELITRGYASEIIHILAAMDPSALPADHRDEYHLLKAKSLTVSGEWDAAAGAFTLALKEGEASDNKLVQSEAHREMGHMGRHRGESDEAIDHYRQALKLSEQIDDLAGIADANRGLGEVYGTKGEFDKALDHHNKSVRSALKAGARRILAKTYIDMGTILCNKGHLDPAADYHKKALDILEELENIQDKAGVNRNLGVVLANKGDHDTALDYFDEAIALSESMGDLQGMGIALASAGEVHIRKRSADIAREYLDEALEIFQKLRMTNKSGWVYLIKSDLLRREGNYTGAEALAQKSLAIFQKSNEPYYVARAHRQLALTYKALKQDQKSAHHEGMVRRLNQQMGISEPKALAG